MLLSCVTIETTTSPAKQLCNESFLNLRARKENFNLRGWFYTKCVRNI